MKKRVFKWNEKGIEPERNSYIEGRIMGIIQTVSGALDMNRVESSLTAHFAMNEDGDRDYKWFRVTCEDEVWECIKGYLLNNDYYRDRITIIRE